MGIDILKLISSEDLIDKEQLLNLKKIIQKSVAPADTNVQFEKLKQQVSELTIENFPGFIMSFFYAGRSDVQRTWFNFDNSTAKEIAEKIDGFIRNLTPDQREKINNEIYDCDLSWSWDYDDPVACLTVGWTEVMLSGV